MEKWPHSAGESNVLADSVILRYFIYVTGLTGGQNLFWLFTWQMEQKEDSLIVFLRVRVNLVDKRRNFLFKPLFFMGAMCNH